MDRAGRGKWGAVTTAPEVHLPEVNRTSPLAVGTIVWLASEVMFFAGLFGAYFALRAAAPGGEWPPPDVHLETGWAAAFTALLVLSSGSMHLATAAIERGDRQAMRRWLLVTVLLAVAFLANQGREWAVADFAADSHAYGSAFFVLTGFHGLHVLGGVLAMAVLLARSLDPGFGHPHAGPVQVTGYYWHVVDVVWVGMFATLFLIR